MGCRSDHLEPTSYEKHTQLVAQLFAHLYEHLGIALPEPVRKAVHDIYANNRDIEPGLCLAMRTYQSSQPQAFDAFVYNGRDPLCRKLAAWWQAHEAADVARNATPKAPDPVMEGLKKLTKAEAIALNLFDQWQAVQSKP